MATVKDDIGSTVNSPFGRLAVELGEMQRALRELGLDGWLLYDLHARNPVAGGLLGLGDLTRRYFVLVPAEGDPCALVHGIEEAPWAGWPWPRRSYVGWRELEQALGALLGDRRRIAMEISPGDAVPALDLVPAGVVELVRAAGAEVVDSGELITHFYARWTAEQLASHLRAADVLAEVAREAFDRVASAVRAGEEPTEGGVAAWVVERLAARGCGVGPDCIVANGVHAADPHYSPDGEGATLGRGDLLLLDLWAKEADHAVYADQTWMAYLGEAVPERAATVWAAVRDARDAAVAFLRERFAARQPVQGCEVDDVSRGVVAQRGFADAFIHRTGHSIDRATHGMGPNIDNLETKETRRLVPGIGFSIEPGIYLAGELGMRTEINVYLGATGPEVTTPRPQSEIFALLAP